MKSIQDIANETGYSVPKVIRRLQIDGHLRELNSGDDIPSKQKLNPRTKGKAQMINGEPYFDDEYIKPFIENWKEIFEKNKRIRP